jgi:hypothetical protein
MTGIRGSRNPKEGGSYNWTGGSMGNQNKFLEKLKPTKGSF